MKKIPAIFISSLLIFAALSCSRIVRRLTNDPNLKKVGDLWPDVPKIDGLSSSEADLPIFVHVLMRTALNNLYRFNKEGEDKTHATGDWAVFSTSKTADEVKGFYTNERMTTFGNWTASKKSTCLDGKEYSFSGVACVFAKKANKRDIGLLIVASQDDAKKQTNIFFVRVESDDTSGTTTQPSTNVTAPASRTEIKPLEGVAPFGIEKRAMPAGVNLDELLPKQVGPYARVLLEKSNERGVTPTSIEVGGASVYATYRDGSKEIFVEFGIADTAHNAQSILDVAATETTNKFPTDPQFGSLATEPSYLRVVNESGAFYAWTRGNYFFSADAKGGETDLNAFMQSFPY
jgi:hypothetical protein